MQSDMVLALTPGWESLLTTNSNCLEQSSFSSALLTAPQT